MRTLRWGSSGEDVKALQSALRARGFYSGAVDGFFKHLTKTAVLSFQRSKGLEADGIVGPLTWDALNLPEASVQTPTKSVGNRRKVSLHIGVNRVDPSKYNGWNGALGGCENDARTMRAIAEATGFRTSVMFTADATADNLILSLSDVAKELSAGDTFLLTYAGHGAQVPNVSGDDEIDDQDETWVLWDRMFLDDELNRAFADFKAGVNVVTFSDSCHSGTMYRKFFDMGQLDVALSKEFYYGEEASSLSLASIPGVNSGVPESTKMLRGVEAVNQQSKLYLEARQDFVSRKSTSRGYQNRSQCASLVKMMRESHPINYFNHGHEYRRVPGRIYRSTPSRSASPVSFSYRNMPIGVNASIVEKYAYLYSSIQRSVKYRGEVLANGLSISGCSDSQLSMEVGGKGVFTTTLSEVWNGGKFVGDYGKFHGEILSRMKPSQTPELGLWGKMPQNLLKMSPFS